MVSNISFNSRTPKKFPKMAAPKTSVMAGYEQAGGQISVKNRKHIPWEQSASKVFDDFIGSAKERSKPIVSGKKGLNIKA